MLRCSKTFFNDSGTCGIFTTGLTVHRSEAYSCVTAPLSLVSPTLIGGTIQKNEFKSWVLTKAMSHIFDKCLGLLCMLSASEENK